MFRVQHKFDHVERLDDLYKGLFCQTFDLETVRALYTKILTLRLTHKLCKPLDDWLDWLIPTNYKMDYKIRWLTHEFKCW